MNTSVRINEPAVLTSWKEVASYLGKGVRTVQRWEKQDGLPIRRIGGTSKVIVNREELDHWLKSQPVDNGGSRPATLDCTNLHVGVAHAKELRERQHELRTALHGEVERLDMECRRMLSICAASGTSLQKKSSPN